MITIYKYYYNGFKEVTMHQGAKILDIQWQDRNIVMWAEVDTDAPLVIHRFVFVGTGHELKTPSESRKYLSTVQDRTGYVWHVFAVL